MLEIKVLKENDTTTLHFEGRLDTLTAPDLQKVLDQELPEAKTLVFDFKELEYVSSAGLRVVLTTYKAMPNKDSFYLVNVSEDIMNLFEVTGFSEFLNIK